MLRVRAHVQPPTLYQLAYSPGYQGSQVPPSFPDQVSPGIALARGGIVAGKMGVGLYGPPIGQAPHDSPTSDTSHVSRSPFPPAGSRRDVRQTARLNRVPVCFKQVVLWNIMWPSGRYRVHRVAPSISRRVLWRFPRGAQRGPHGRRAMYGQSAVQASNIIRGKETGGEVGPHLPPLASALGSLPYHLNMPHIMPRYIAATHHLPSRCHASLQLQVLSSLAVLQPCSRSLLRMVRVDHVPADISNSTLEKYFRNSKGFNSLASSSE